MENGNRGSGVISRHLAWEERPGLVFDPTGSRVLRFQNPFPWLPNMSKTR